MSRVENGLNPVTEIFKNFIKKTGMNLFQKQNEELEKVSKFNIYVKMLIDTYVPKLLHFHERMEKLSVTSFDNSLEFHKALSDGFKSFVNQDFQKDSFKVKTGQIFAFYCDEILRKKDNELDDKFEKIVKFIQFFTDKDLFVEEYRIQLSKRLLSVDSHEREQDERNMISKLKRNYRAVSDLHKLEKMLLDKTSSFNLKQDFVKFEDLKEIPFDFNVNVLTMGTWPMTIKEPFIPPTVFMTAQNIFKKFYDTKFERRVLNWSYLQGSTVQLLGHFNQQKLFDSTTIQASILLMYNNVDSLKFEDILNELGLTPDTLKKTLNSLIMSNLLVREEEGSVDQVDWEKSNYKFNTSFEHKLYKIKLQPPRLNQNEVTKNQLKIESDRTFILDAVIVRIMKSKKQIGISELITCVMEHVLEQFKPDPKMIKKRIESLIERDYLQREQENTSIILYCA
jgi:cullin 1